MSRDRLVVGRRQLSLSGATVERIGTDLVLVAGPDRLTMRGEDIDEWESALRGVVELSKEDWSSKAKLIPNLLSDTVYGLERARTRSIFSLADQAPCALRSIVTCLTGGCHPPEPKFRRDLPLPRHTQLHTPLLCPL